MYFVSKQNAESGLERCRFLLWPHLFSPAEAERYDQNVLLFITELQVCVIYNVLHLGGF